MSSRNSWFVQTGFGTVLGPMPADALSEMVRTGALIASDLVRTESSAEWEPATNVPGLFSNSSSPLMTHSEQSRDAHSEERPPDTLTLPSSRRPTTPTATVAYAFDKLAAPQPPQAEDLVAKWKAERQQRTKRRHENHDDHSLAQQIERDANHSGVEPIPDIFADEAVEQISNQIPKTVALSDRDPTPAATPLEPRQTIKRPSLLSQIAPDLPAIPTEKFAQKRNRWMRSLPSKPIMAAVIVLSLTAWWFWPRSQRPVYNRLVAIWNELQIQRAHPLDKSGMADFVARAQTELNVIVPKLSKQTNSDDRESLLLLSVGRDCLQPMLKRPRERDSSREQQLALYFQELAVHYGRAKNVVLVEEREPVSKVTPAPLPNSEVRESNPTAESPPQPPSSDVAK